MRTFFYYLFMLFVLIGCQRSPGLGPAELFFLDSTPSPGVSPVDANNDLFNCGGAVYPTDTSSRYCEFVQGEDFPLPEAAKYWLPQYSFAIGTNFRYMNKDSETIELSLTEKEHILVNRVMHRDSCAAYPDKRTGICHEIELFYVILENAEQDLKMYVEVGVTQFKNPGPDPFFTPQGQIWLSRLTSEGTFSQWMWPEELDESEFQYQLFDFAEEQTILNRTFDNVWSRNDWYYSKEIGLLAFQDGEDVLWVLQE
ncbi:MAG: hypothetical protein AAF587_41010 [Bacteroidota bacterium]